ncbi:hypothetical protein J5N97_008489 [Dioscorea zingiberensis]|uniref:Uncharacterized protein n=1 Tax=Dioscorea zingiberensis TaxID=325984 RepID=A0A9D5CWK9_9LILI|nr:hypothetical protein J5N97_008489 [Dioscorea zingiberensis]
MEDRLQRYGKIYRSNLFSASTVVLVRTDERREAVLIQLAEERGRHIGKDFDAGAHRRDASLYEVLVRELYWNCQASESLLSERYILENLATWKDSPPFTTKEEACKITFNLMGVVAISSNLPGTVYRKAIQSRATILKTIEHLMEARLEKKKAGTDNIGEADLLGFALE